MLDFHREFKFELDDLRRVDTHKMLRSLTALPAAATVRAPRKEAQAFRLLEARGLTDRPPTPARMTIRKRSAIFSTDVEKQFRYTLTRVWDEERPMLLVVILNPSRSDDLIDRLVAQVASHNGYGGMVIVGLIPAHSADPKGALAWLKEPSDLEQAQSHRQAMRRNARYMADELGKASAVLVAWGGLIGRLPEFESCMKTAMGLLTGSGLPLMCLGTTMGGHPLHPLGRGKHRVLPTQDMRPWIPC
ncbi:hypothetical protein BH10PSE18_BH10PSE18_34220 [soil metagenome]